MSMKLRVGRNYSKVWFALVPMCLLPAICNAAGPTISSLSPTSGAVGTSVTITGSNFGTSQGSSTVTFNGTSASITSWGSTSIKATVPSAATTGNVVVTVGGVASNGKNFTVVPHISSLTPSSGAVGASITIAGTTFGSTQGSSTVKFNGTTASVTSWSSTSIVAAVPSGATTGNVVVTVSSQASNGVSFTVLPTPSISSVSPSSGAVGAAVTISGSNFGSSQGSGSVSFNGTAATVGTWSSGSITTTAPAGATTGNVVVNAGGVNTNGIAFTVLPTPSITSLSVTSGAVGAAVTISGSNLGSTQGSGSVSFNGTAAVVTSWSATSVAVTVPSGATTGNVVVNASGVNTNGIAFTVLPTPSISSLSVTSGMVGAAVTITGTNFGSTQGSGAVKFNGTTATVTNWSATSIAATVPSGATTGPVVVNTSGVLTNGIVFTVLATPNITGLSPASGAIGESVTIMGTGFEPTQGSSTVTLNGTAVPVTSWSDIAIVVVVPSGASSGPFSVTVNGQTVQSSTFTVTSLPSGWLDSDIGSVGVAGSATYASGVFSQSGAGSGIFGTTDGLNFAYQSLSGDGTIVARVMTSQGNNAPLAGLMIRETLDPSATNALAFFRQGSISMSERTTTGGNPTSQYGMAATLPYWLKLVRSGNNFSAFSSYNGLTWAQIGTTQTISMAQNVYIGMVVTNQSTSAAATATFDNVSVNSAAAPAPIITAVSGTTGAVGSQVTLIGTGFGNSQNGSLVVLNDAPVDVDSWNATAITITIPTGATSGYMVVSVAPAMNDSNPVYFTVASQPLPPPWLDQDLGPVGLAGTATYSSGVFTLNASGSGIYYPPDEAHLAYQMTSGNGTIVAHVVSVSGTSSAEAAVMIRQSLDPSDADAYVYCEAGSIVFAVRSTAGAASTTVASMSQGLPYWVELVRNGNSFSAYTSPDGINWTQLGTTQTVTMVQNVYIGLAASNQSNSSLATAKLDNVSVTTSGASAPTITSVSATTGSVGNLVTIFGAGFGDVQGGSVVLLNSVPVTIDLWSNTYIEFTIPSGAASGNLVVSVAPSMNDSNPVYFVVTAQPLPISLLNFDVGDVGMNGSSTFANGVYTVTGAGLGTFGTPDGLQFVYQALSGDGTIVARLTGIQGSSDSEAGVMIRETLSSSATNAFVCYYGG